MARTFLAVVDTGSFIAAAERIFVAQSTVSMRIKALEEQLGKALFVRNKAGAVLTPAGRQFQRHAQSMVRVWQQARLEVALPAGYQAALTVGGQYSLWDGFLLRWLPWMREHAPNLALRAQLAPAASLMQMLVAGALDLAVMYTPESRPGFEVEHLYEEDLVLTSSERRPSRRLGERYVFVDWGPEFRADHALNYPEQSTPALYFDIGSLGLNYLLENRASGFFPRRLVAPYVAAGQLAIVESATAFTYPAYAVYPADGEAAIYEVALAGLRAVAGRLPGAESAAT